MASRGGKTRHDQIATDIERMLDEHLENGLIRSWHKGGPASLFLWQVRLANGQTVLPYTLDEASMLCYGLSSASQAHRDGRYQAAQESETGPRA